MALVRATEVLKSPIPAANEHGVSRNMENMAPACSTPLINCLAL
ncbi:MAG: hypothetical protein ACR2FY_17280 [Pirellulaceae bacterium]